MRATSSTSSTASSPAGSITGSILVLILLLAISALTACATGTTRTVAIPTTQAEADLPPPLIDAALLAKCPPAPIAADSRFPTLMRNHKVVAQLYNDCRGRDGKLVDAVTAREQIEAQRRARIRAATQKQLQPPVHHWWQW